jgi:hypothetical protein
VLVQIVVLWTSAKNPATPLGGILGSLQLLCAIGPRPEMRGADLELLKLLRATNRSTSTMARRRFACRMARSSGGIDPARVKIANIPFPESGYRWGDIVLHDGEPNGERVSGETRYDVFDVLERWSPSEIPTIVIEADCGSEEDALALIEMFESSHFAAEDWTRSVRPLCQACSTGKPGDHDHPFTKDGAFHSFGIACPAGLAATILERWALSSPQVRRYKWKNADD